MENFDRIQDYLLGNLAEAERLLFEKEVAQNEELASQLAFQRFELETMDQLEEDSLRAKAQALKAKAGKEEAKVRIIKPKTSRSGRWAMLAIAATVALLIGVFLFQQSGTTRSDLIAQGYSIAKPAYDNTVRGGEETPITFDPAMLGILKNREQSKAQLAIQYFKKFPNNTQARLNLGHAYALEADFQNAIDVFRQLESSTTIASRKREEVRYFRALALLGNEDAETGLELLQEIAEAKGRYAGVAEALLKEAGE